MEDSFDSGSGKMDSFFLVTLEMGTRRVGSRHWGRTAAMSEKRQRLGNCPSSNRNEAASCTWQAGKMTWPAKE